MTPLKKENAELREENARLVKQVDQLVRMLDQAHQMRENPYSPTPPPDIVSQLRETERINGAIIENYNKNLADAGRQVADLTTQLAEIDAALHITTTRDITGNGRKEARYNAIATLLVNNGRYDDPVVVADRGDAVLSDQIGVTVEGVEKRYVSAETYWTLAKSVANFARAELGLRTAIKNEGLSHLLDKAKRTYELAMDLDNYHFVLSYDRTFGLDDPSLQERFDHLRAIYNPSPKNPKDS